MISRPDRAWGAALHAWALTLGLALVLAGCADGPRGAETTRPAGSGPVVSLLEQARGAMGAGELAEAGRLLDEALAIEADNPAVWVAIARLRFRGGEQIAAVAAADRALELGPAHGPALLMLAQLVRDAHGPAAARQWFEAALAADSADARIRTEYAATVGASGDYRAMLDALGQIGETEPQADRAHFLRAVLAARAGESVLARSLLARSGLSEKGVPAAVLLDALIHLAQGNHDSAAVALGELARRQSGNVRVAELHARALWLGRRDRKLVDLYAARARQAGASPYLSMLVGRSLERLGQRGEAAPFLDRAMAGPTGEPAVLAERESLPEPTRRLRSLLETGDRRAALREARALSARLATSSDISALAGDVMLGAGDAESALELYRDAVAVRRSWPLAKKAIHAFRLLDDHAAADRLLARHVAGEPNNAEALAMLAARSAEAQDWLRVKLLLDRVIALGGGNDPALLRLRGEAAQALGEAQEADRFAVLARTLAPQGFVPR